MAISKKIIDLDLAIQMMKAMTAELERELKQLMLTEIQSRRDENYEMSLRK